MKAFFKTSSILWLCALLSLSLGLAAQKGGVKAKGKDKEPQSIDRSDQAKERDRDRDDRGIGREDRDRDRDDRPAVKVFGRSDRDVIKRHLRTNRDSLPPGLAKRDGDLPPGLEKQLRRNGHLPPGLEKRLHPFPDDLERRLPRLREGLVRGVLGDRAVIMEQRTSRILDAFRIR